MPQDDSVELHGTLTIDDLTKFQYFHSLRKSWPVFAVLALIPALGLPFLVITLFARDDDWHVIMTNSLPFFLMCLFFIFAVGVAPKRNARKQFEAQSYLREPITYLFTGD